MTAAAIRRERLQAAADLVAGCHRANTDPEIVIAELVRVHDARFRSGATTNLLRVAGVQATCIWSKGEGLLAAWTRNATLALMRMAGDLPPSAATYASETNKDRNATEEHP